MRLEDVTPVILTYNEEPNLARCLSSLNWAKEVIVLDSCSTDGTEAVARSFPNVRFEKRPFDDHTSQWNHAIALSTKDWVLSLDADYGVPESFTDELRTLNPRIEISAFRVRFCYCVFGRPLRSTLYPPRAVLFRRERCRYAQDGHTQLLKIDGETNLLSTTFDHDDRKPLCRWLVSQDNYARLEVVKLTGASRAEMRLQDRIRCWLVVAPLLTLPYTLLMRGVILDGWAGWHYAFQRTVAEIILSLRLLEKKLLNRDG